MTKTYIAQCHCGDVQITCEGEPRAVFMCSCTLCQRRTGSILHIGAWWPMDDVTMSGETKRFTRTTGELGLEATVNFCPRCGTSLWWGGETEGEGPLLGHYGIAGGCFADPELPPPMLSVYERTKHPWINAPEGTLCFSAMPEDPGVWDKVAEAMQRTH